MCIFIIAEAGVNHNGDTDLALRLIDAAVDSGADAIKFQSFRADEVAIPEAPKAAYQKQTTDGAESQLEMIRKFELSEPVHRELVAHCATHGIRFLSTPFDLPSLDFLVHGLGLTTLKVPSGEITNGPLLLRAAQSGCDLILSTGMSTSEDIEEALGVLAFGFSDGGSQPEAAAFRAAFSSETGQAALRKKVTLLHCTTAYPTPCADANLKVMAMLSERFGLAVGYSDHTPGIAVATAAAALGATIVEKHFTLDRNLPGPDHPASLEPGELTAMVAAVRNVEAALGRSEKSPAPSEQGNMAIARKSLVTLKPVAAGEAFSVENLGVKRPGNGISPMQYWRWLGRPAARDFPEGVLVSE